MSGFFEFAVIGAIAGPRFGLARACEECVERRAGREACGGFGAGCLGMQEGVALRGPLPARNGTR